MGMVESAKFLLTSRYICDLATLVVAYGISINLVEVTWKSTFKMQFSSSNDSSSFMGDFSTYTGVATFIMMLSRYIFKKYGWGVAAAITPTVLLVTGVAFFGLVLFSIPLTPMLAGLRMTPLLAAVYVGALQNIFSKSAKYSLFDLRACLWTRKPRRDGCFVFEANSEIRVMRAHIQRQASFPLGGLASPRSRQLATWFSPRRKWRLLWFYRSAG